MVQINYKNMIRCPGCGNKNPKFLQTVTNIDTDAVVDERLLCGDCAPNDDDDNDTKCGDCGRSECIC